MNSAYILNYVELLFTETQVRGGVGYYMDISWLRTNKLTSKSPLIHCR